MKEDDWTASTFFIHPGQHITFLLSLRAGLRGKISDFTVSLL
jgi:hypothetical protein